MQSLYLQRIMKKNADKGYEKTKPKTKPISETTKMNENLFATKDYENKYYWTLGENKPNSKLVLSAVEWANFSYPQESQPCLPSVALAKVGAQPALSIFILSFVEVVEGPKGDSQWHFWELSCKEWLPGLEKRWHYELIGDKIV